MTQKVGIAYPILPILLWLGPSGLACANDTAPADSSTATVDILNEVVVTARRQEESIQRTPVAVTAISADALANQKVEDVHDLQGAVPNLSILTGAPATAGFAIVSIRGQANYNNNTASDPAVGVYIDGVYVARPAGSLLDMSDVDRVEVLRGPQGTLFGRNTVGGAVNILTKQPNGEFAGEVSVEGGDYGYRKESGILNVPLIGNELDFRIVARHSDVNDGYGHNATLDRPTGDVHDEFVRAQLRYAPESIKWNFTLSADWDKNFDHGQMVTLQAYNPLIVGFLPLAQYLQTSSNYYTSYGDRVPQLNGTAVLPRDDLAQQGYSLRINGDLGWSDFKSLTSYRALNTIGYTDLDGTPFEILSSTTSYLVRNWTQELQLSGDHGPFSWIGGLFYFHETGHEVSNAQFYGFASPTDPIAMMLANIGDVTSDSEAAYAQGYYHITDKLRLSAGYRRTWDKREADLHNFVEGGLAFGAGPYPPGVTPDTPICTVAAPGVPCSLPESVKFQYPAYTVGLDFQATDTLFLYTSLSSAYLSGAWNLRASAVPAVAPEADKTWEMGLKADWLDHRLRTNLALFHSWQSNVQRQINSLVNGISTAYTINAGNAQINGAEFEVQATPWHGMELSAGVGLMEGGYERGTYRDHQTVVLASGAANPNSAECSVLAGAASGTYYCGFDRSGEPLPQFPHLTYNIGATQILPTPVGDLTLHMDFAYISDQHYVGNTAAPEQPSVVQAEYALARQEDIIPSHGLLDARATLQVRNTGLELALWGKNLTNQQYLADHFDSYVSVGMTLGFPAPPRTYGGTVTYRF